MRPWFRKRAIGGVSGSHSGSLATLPNASGGSLGLARGSVLRRIWPRRPRLSKRQALRAKHESRSSREKALTTRRMAANWQERRGGAGTSSRSRARHYVPACLHLLWYPRSCSTSFVLLATDFAPATALTSFRILIAVSSALPSPRPQPAFLKSPTTRSSLEPEALAGHRSKHKRLAAAIKGARSRRRIACVTPRAMWNKALAPGVAHALKTSARMLTTIPKSEALGGARVPVGAVSMLAAPLPSQACPRERCVRGPAGVRSAVSATAQQQA